MGRQRMVRPELFVHEDLFAAERKAGLPLRLAYVGLWTQCDREGRFEWRPQRLKLAVLPWDDLDFGAVLDALAEAGFVHRYEVDGKPYGYIPSWHRHQKPHHQEAKSVIPPPPARSDSPHGAKGLGESPNGFAPTSEALRPLARSDSPENEDGNEDKDADESADEDEGRNTSASAECEKDNPYPPEFLTFWAAYPRCVEKRRAFRAWKARCNDGVSAEDLVRAAKHYAAGCAARRTEAKYIKHPATFLGPDKPYEDWINPPTPELRETNGEQRESERQSAGNSSRSGREEIIIPRSFKGSEVG